MKSSGIFYLISEGIKNVFKNKKSSATSIITMICAMFLFGIFFAIGENVNSVLEQVQMKQGMEVFLFDFATDEQIADMEEQIKALDGVNTVVFKTKEQALESFKESMSDYKDAIAGLEGENNVLPASFVITLTDLEKNEEVQEKILKIGEALLEDETIDEEMATTLGEYEIDQPTIIQKLTNNNPVIEKLIELAKGVRYAIGVIFAILLIIAVTIISNTIKLTVHARRKEISIMKYVGATNGFIRWPFVVEGIIIGLVAAIITFLIVGFSYDFIVNKIASSTVLQSLSVTLLAFTDLAELIAIVYGVLGIGLGIFGSSISMKKYLEV